MSVKDNNRDWEKYKRTMAHAATLEVAVGIFENAKGLKGESVAEYATYNEFGTEKVPSRPFMAISFDSNKAAIEADILGETKAMAEGRRTPEQALARVGLRHADRIKNTITGPNIPPPLAPSTVARKKGSTKTLVDTGAMVNSVQIAIRAK